MVDFNALIVWKRLIDICFSIKSSLWTLTAAYMKFRRMIWSMIWAVACGHRSRSPNLDVYCYLIETRAVRRRTGGRRRRWVVLWPAAARRAFFIGGVALWSASAASDRMREHWNSALAKQAFFSGFTGVSRRVKCEYACCARFHSHNEWIVHCLISGGSYKCSVERTLKAREWKMRHWKTRDWKMWK